MNDVGTKVGTAPAGRWSDEYRKGGIPSSVRSRPSNVVTEFVETVRRSDLQARHALDIGCGTGRNSIYLAEQGYVVRAIDYSTPQVAALAEIARSRPELQLHVSEGSVTQPWPWNSACADFAIDTFCFKHQIEMDGINVYINEARRCLRPGGRYLLYLALREDGYYSQFPAPHQYGTGLIIGDHGNGIPSRLYSPDEIVGLFRGFRVVNFAEKASRNEMHGQTYERRSGVWHLQRI